MIDQVQDYDGRMYKSRRLRVEGESEATLTDQDLRAWLGEANETDTPLRMIVGSPGSGKTWLLHQLAENLKSATRLEEMKPQAVFFLEAAKTLGKDDIRWEGELHGWLANEANRTLLDEVKMYHNENVAFRSIFAALVERICNGYGDFALPVILLIDGLEDLPPAAQAYCERHVLEPFLSASREGCARAVVGGRTALSLQLPALAWSVAALDLVSEPATTQHPQDAT